MGVHLGVLVGRRPLVQLSADLGHHASGVALRPLGLTAGTPGAIAPGAVAAGAVTAGSFACSTAGFGTTGSRIITT
jgi:hypothetical protein